MNIQWPEIQTLRRVVLLLAERGSVCLEAPFPKGNAWIHLRWVWWSRNTVSPGNAGAKTPRQVMKNDLGDCETPVNASDVRKYSKSTCYDAYQFGTSFPP